MPRRRPLLRARSGQFVVSRPPSLARRLRINWAATWPPFFCSPERLHHSEQLSQCHPSRPIAAHAVHSAARRRRRRAEIQAFTRGGVHLSGGAEESLGEIRSTSVDVAANQVGI